MPQCKHYDICGRDVEGDPADGLCILHSTDPAKDTHTFDKALATHRKRHGDNFAHFIFPAGVNFAGARFSGEARFLGARFSEAARFPGAAFSGEADFARARFSGEADFVETTFSGEADFAGAAFSEDARFYKAMFSKEVAFTEAAFTKRVDFARATFTKGVDFTEATFGEYASFHQTTFSGRTRFVGRPGSTQASHIFADTVVNFRQVVIEPLDAVTFVEADLTKSHFLDTDLRKIQLVGITWPQKRWRVVVSDDTAVVQYRRRWILRLLLWGLVVIPLLWTGITNLRRHLGYGGSQPWSSWFDIATGWGIWIPGIVIGIVVVRRVGGWIDLKPSYNPRPWSQIERLYRELKRNYEDRRDYERAGDFHYGEKEMRRQNPASALGLRFFLTLYCWFSGYGERYLRPLLWAGLLFVLSTIGYMWWGLRLKDGSSSLAWTYPWINPWDWLRAAYYSFRVMTLLKPDDWVPLRYAQLVNTFQTLLGPTFLGLFALALRQRLKR